MLSEDIFTLSKNRRPIEAKNRKRNASAEHTLAHLKGRYGIVKTYHVHEGDNCWTNRHHEKMDRTVMRQDLRPFVLYSMNKKRNWEIDELVGVQLMAEIRKLHKGEDVFLIERVALQLYYWPNVFRHHCHWENFRIRTVHELNPYVSGRPSYEGTTVDSVYGQYLPHFLKHNRCDNKEDSEIIRKKKMKDREKEMRTVVAYHLIKPPENYMTIFQKQFVRNTNYPGRWNDPSYLERLRNKDIIKLNVRYDDYDSDSFDENENTEEDVFEQVPRTSTYNLEDHFVEHFVNVKKKKMKKSS